MRGFRAGQHIAYMVEHGMTRDQLATMPCRIVGINPGVLSRLSQGGIIKRQSRTNNGTIWQEGPYYKSIMEAWSCAP